MKVKIRQAWFYKAVKQANLSNFALTVLIILVGVYARLSILKTPFKD